ncbi:HNH endonuclease [Nocardia caishijiensis]|uniref:HNH endonuclease n=1 Tax=Nocardia caishijiensis TaxID=184756 RepID=UPI0009FFD810|nr:HNH endonuclease signature motif containing protein [Nocardia caishijiensis]
MPSNWENSTRKDRLPPDWARRRSQALRRDGRRCQIRDPECSDTATEVDHVIQGDDHSLPNLRAVCTGCHRRKTSRDGVARRQALRAARLRPRDRHPGETRN